MAMNFEWFVDEGKVERRSPNVQLARGLVDSSQDRLQSAREYVKHQPKYAFEDAYEAVIELIDGLLALEGYKSYSHEANISFLAKLNGFTSVEIENLDRLRKKRNGSKYYARTISQTEAESDMTFLGDIFSKVLTILKQKLVSK